jgi:hypothetical protein
MHYIVGTRISITVNAKAGLFSRDKRFKPGVNYMLINIKPENSKYKYVFVGSDRSTVEQEFASCREGDKFIASLRNETLPDYDAPANIIDTIAD